MWVRGEGYFVVCGTKKQSRGEGVLKNAGVGERMGGRTQGRLKK